MDGETLAVGSPGAAETGGVDRGRRLLDRAGVVERVAAAVEEFGILDRDLAPGRVRPAVETLPRVLDQSPDRLVPTDLRPDADDLDAGDEPSLVAWVVALAAAEAVEPLAAERLGRRLRAPGLLLEGADGADAEHGRDAERRLGPHREGAVGTEEVEPQQDTIAARAVHLAALERSPDGVAVAAGRVHAHEPPGQEERRGALEVEHLEGRDPLRRRRGVERDGFRGALGRRRGRALGPLRVPWAGGLGHHAPRVLLVAGARAGGVVVARCDEPETEAARVRRVVEGGDRHRVLDRAPGPVVEGGVEAVAALPAVLPVLDAAARERHPSGRLGVEEIDAGGSHPTLAFHRRDVAAAGAHELARLPAAREIALRRRRTDGLAVRAPGDLVPVPVLLRVAVARVDLDQGLPVRVVLRADELLVPARARRGVETPGVPVRDDDRLETPLRELLEQLAGGVRGLAAVVGQLTRVDARGAERNLGELVLEAPEVVVALAVREIEDRKTQALPERRALAEGADQALIERAHGASRDAILGRLAEDDVLVPVMVGRRYADLRPFPAEKRHQVRVRRVSGHRVALPDRLLRLPPVRRGDRLRVVGDRPEVEVRAEAGEVAGIRRRMGALALEHGEAADEGVGGERRVDVQVAEQDLLRALGLRRTMRERHVLSGGAGRDDRRRHGRPRDLPRLLVPSPAPQADEQCDRDPRPVSHEPSLDGGSYTNVRDNARARRACASGTCASCAASEASCFLGFSRHVSCATRRRWVTRRTRTATRARRASGMATRSSRRSGRTRPASSTPFAMPASTGRSR